MCQRRIATFVRRSVGFVNKIINRFIIDRSLVLLSHSSNGRPPLLSPDDLRCLADLVLLSPQSWQKDFVAALSAQRDVDVSLSTVSRALAHLDITRKRVCTLFALVIFISCTHFAFFYVVNIYFSSYLVLTFF